MAQIEDRELVKMGDGNLLKYNKMYIPANVVKYLGLDAGKSGVTYYQIFDPDYTDVVVIKKLKKK